MKKETAALQEGLLLRISLLVLAQNADIYTLREGQLLYVVLLCIPRISVHPKLDKYIFRYIVCVAGPPRVSFNSKASMDF